MSAEPLLADAPWLIAGGTARVLELLNANGEEARVVGGAVRNALLDLAPGDIDIALVIDSQPYEVTTLREDTETFGRKAKVVFGRDWVKDAERRDFTMNGLSVDAAGVVHDHVGGIADTAARRVRFIGDPNQRIAEDYLRILRFFRIHAAFGAGDPDRDGYLACIRGRMGLAHLSAERVRMEMLKLLVAGGASAAVLAMAEGGLLQALIGGVAYTGPLATMIAIERELGLTASPTRRLAALTVAVTEDAKRVALRLRLSNTEAKALDSMGHRWWRFAAKDEAHARRLLYRLGADRYHDRVLLGWARAENDVHSLRWRELAELPLRWTPPKFPLRAADFIARGMAEGPALGHVLTLAEDAWLAADFPLEEAALASIADQAAARVSRERKT